MIRRLVGSALCLLLVAVLLRHWWRAHPPDETLEHIREKGVLVIGMDTSYPPFADGRSGKPIGLDVDVANAIAARLGVRAQIRELGYDGLYDALKVGTVDAIISALSVDPMQLGDVMYTQGYFDAGIVIVSRAGQFAQMMDLEGRTVSVEYGTAADTLVGRWQRRLHRLDKLPYPNPDAALDAVRSDKSDAAIVDSISARLYLRTHTDLVISPTPVQPDPYVVAVRLGTGKLAEAISEAIDAMSKDGTLEAIVRRWL